MHMLESPKLLGLLTLVVLSGCNPPDEIQVLRPDHRVELEFEATGAILLAPGAERPTATLVERYLWEIVDLDHIGETVARWGRQGEGPGEFKLVSRLARSGDGTLWVFDLGRMVGMAFGPGGAYLDETRIPGYPVAIRGTPSGFEGIFSDRQRLLRITVTEPSEEPVVSDFNPSIRGIDSPEALTRFAGGSFAPDGGVVLADGGSGEILRAGPGLEVATIGGRGLEPRLPTEADLEVHRRNFRATAKLAGVSMDGVAEDMVIEQLRTQPMPIYRPVAAAIDDEGRYWIASAGQVEGRSLMDVFSADGEFLASVALEGEVQGLSFSAGWAVAVTLLDSGVTALDYYPESQFPL